MTAAKTPRIACFGYVNPGEVFSVDRYPTANTGAYVTGKRPFIGADCCMAAQVLAHWGMEAHLIANDLGDDDAGRDALDRLAEMGVHTHMALRDDLRTPLEVDISDRSGTRTFFVEHNPPVWDSLIDAELDAIGGADMLYLDWYVGPPAGRAIAYACAHDVPIFLNVEYSLRYPERYRDLVAQANYIQSPMSDVHVDPEDPMALAVALRDLGAQVAFVTRGKHGSLTVADNQLIESPAPIIDVVDTQGAGAVFSAAAMYGLIRRWPLSQIAQIATIAASRKCAQHGLLATASMEALVAEMAT
jgi:sugar/nucleoside kinase (ribokinase family)